MTTSYASSIATTALECAPDALGNKTAVRVIAGTYPQTYPHTGTVPPVFARAVGAGRSFLAARRRRCMCIGRCRVVATETARCSSPARWSKRRAAGSSLTKGMTMLEDPTTKTKPPTAPVGPGMAWAQTVGPVTGEAAIGSAELGGAAPVLGSISLLPAPTGEGTKP